jgi:hypothetical protein
MAMKSQKSQTLLSRIKNDDLRAAASACFDIADELGARRAQLDSSGKYTERGRSQEMTDILKKEFGPRLRQVQQPLVASMQQIEVRKNKLSLPAPDSSPAAALDRQEIRRHLLSLPIGERTKLAFETRDQRVLEAILTAPAMLSGFPEDRFQQLADTVRERVHGPEMALIRQTEADVEEARMVVKVATNDLKEATGLDDNLFFSIVSNTRAGAPWLKRDGEKVVVIKPGEPTALPATAEEIAVGKFYLNHAEYLGDRPAGTPYTAVATAAA